MSETVPGHADLVERARKRADEFPILTSLPPQEHPDAKLLRELAAALSTPIVPVAHIIDNGTGKRSAILVEKHDPRKPEFWVAGQPPAGYIVTPLYGPDALAALRAELAAVKRERDDALSEVEELRSQAETIAEEFEKDCWKAMKSLLTECNFEWRDVEPDGVSAEDAREYISTTLDEMEKGEQRWKSRAEAADAEVARLKDAGEGWRPMSSAPMDGTRVILLLSTGAGDMVHIGRKDPRPVSGWEIEPHGYWTSVKGWIPLPAAHPVEEKLP